MKYIYCKTCGMICTFEEHADDIMHDSSEHVLGKGGEHTVLGYDAEWKLPDNVKRFESKQKVKA